MAITYQELSYVIGPWGGKVLKDVDKFLGDNDGWIEDSDFYLSGGTEYTQAKVDAIEECAKYCSQFINIKGPDGKGIYDNALLLKISELNKTPKGQLPNANLFHDTALGCIAAASTLSYEKLEASLMDHAAVDAEINHGQPIEPTKDELLTAAKHSVDFNDPIFTAMTNQAVFASDPFVEESGKAYSVNGHIIKSATKALTGIKPEDLAQSVVSTDFYRCSDFGYKNLKYASTLRVDANDANTVDMINTSEMLGKTFTYVMRQKKSYDAATGEYVVKISALPQSKLYNQFLQKLGLTTENGDEKAWIEWRICSDGNGGSQVYLAFSIETTLPEWLQKGIYALVMPTLFDNYIEGFKIMGVTKRNIKVANAWETPVTTTPKLENSGF